MKNRIILVLALLAGSGATALTFTGCSAMGTSKSTGEYIDDAAITTKVKASLVRDPVVSALQVNVTTYKGVVQLSGFVDTPEQKARAEEIARNTPGASGVQDNIAIKTQR